MRILRWFICWLRDSFFEVDDAEPGPLVVDIQAAVRDFHQKFGAYIGSVPAIPPVEERRLRVALIMEEAKELCDAILNNDLVGVADGIADLMYVTAGTSVSYGIDIAPIFIEVHRSNMSKVWPDGTVHRRADGKVEKPPTYSPADLEPLLIKQGCHVDSLYPERWRGDLAAENPDGRKWGLEE